MFWILKVWMGSKNTRQIYKRQAIHSYQRHRSVCNLWARKAQGHQCWKLEGFIGAGFLNFSCSALFLFLSFCLPWDPLLGAFRYKTWLNFLRWSWIEGPKPNCFSRCLILSSSLVRMSLKENWLFWKILARNAEVCVMSVKLFLCGQWLTHIFISFCLTRVWLHPKPEGFIFSLEEKETPSL